jgi:hypothetical protein
MVLYHLVLGVVFLWCVLYLAMCVCLILWYGIRCTQFCLRMGTELVPETLYSNELTRLCAREDYIESCCHDSFKTYICSFSDKKPLRMAQ